jgi:hypothetical protein
VIFQSDDVNGAGVSLNDGGSDAISGCHFSCLRFSVRIER